MCRSTSRPGAASASRRISSPRSSTSCSASRCRYIRESWSRRLLTPCEAELDRAHLPHAGVVHVEHGFRERAFAVDGAAGVVDEHDLEAGGARVEGGPGDAEIGGEAAEVDFPEAPLLQVAAQAGAGFAVGLDEGGVTVDAAVMSLADHE